MSYWYDDSKGRWCLRIRRRGREARETLPAGTTRAQAEARHARLVRDFVDATYLGRERHTVADGLNRLIEHHLPERTGHHVLSNIRALLPYVQGRPLAELVDVAQEYTAAARAEGLTPATINRRLAVLRRVGLLAWRSWQWLDRPPAIVTLPERNQRHVYLSHGEVELLAWFAGHWHPVAGVEVLCAAYTGLRRGELAALTRADISRTAIHVRTSKSGRPRVVPVIPRIAAPLRLYVASRKRRPHPRTLHEAFKMGARAIGRPALRFHDLRHTTASLLAAAGVDLYTIGEILGHADKRTTARYTHLTTGHLQAAMAKIAPGGRNGATAASAGNAVARFAPGAPRRKAKKAA
jgi:integrase